MLHTTFSHAGLTLYHLTLDLIRFLVSLLQPRSALAAENLFLRKQLALYRERQVRPRRATDATRLTMVLLGRLFDWKEALISVRPETFTGWHRQGFQLLWRWKSLPIGRPRIPEDLRQLILTMARDNPTRGQARIAAELLLKLGIQVSPRTVQKYLLEDPTHGRRRTVPSQRWMTFVRNHAKAIVASDFFISVTARFRGGLCVSHHGSRNTATHPLQCHFPSHLSLDLTAVSGGHRQRTGLPISGSRSGQHLLSGIGSGCKSHGSENPQDSLPISTGEFLLRTTDRKPAPGLSGFFDSDQ